MKRLSGVLIVVGVAGVWAYGVTSHLYYLIGGIALGALGPLSIVLAEKTNEINLYVQKFKSSECTEEGEYAENEK